MICVADEMKEDSPQAIAELKNMGVHVVMLTGDRVETAQAIGARAGVDEVIAGVLPDGKEEVVRRFSQDGHVMMVGDGINDAPALTRADVGVAIGAGTDIAIDAADVVLVNSRLTDVAAAIRLSRRTLRNIHENLILGIFLQCHWYSVGSRTLVSVYRMGVKPDVWCGGNEPFQFLRRDQRPAFEFCRYLQYQAG